jgi:transcriptional regulator with XRE-family HTH domain
MNKQSIYWSTNLRFLRNRKKWSQEELAERLGITRAKLNAHENGKTVNPTADDLIAFSAFFRMSIDTLLKVDLSKISELSLRELESGNDGYATGTKLRVLATTVDRDNNENIEYVPIKAKAGYLAGHTDPEFIATLPRFSMPQLPANRTYRMFPTTGPSMLPIPEGSLIIAEYVQDWLSLKDDTLCILILKSAGQDFVFKQVENRIRKDRSLLLKSLNETFKPYEVPVADVLEIWRYVSYVSEAIPSGNITLGQIAQSLKEIRVDVAGLAERI